MKEYNFTNRIITAIDRYSRYLNEFANQQMNIAEKTAKLLEEKKLREFGTKIQERLNNVKSLADIVKTTSELTAEATSSGLMQAIPLIEQQSKQAMTRIGLAESEKLSKAILESLDKNELIIKGGKLTTVGEIVNSDEFKDLTPETLTAFLQSLKRPLIELRGSRINGKELLFEQFRDPNSKNILQTNVYDIKTKNNKKFYVKNGVEVLVPNEVLDELSHERFDEIKKQIALLEIRNYEQKNTLDNALKLQQLASNTKKEALEDLIAIIAYNTIMNDEDEYSSNEKKSNLYKSLREIYNEKSIDWYTTPLGEKELRDKLGNNFYLVEPALRTIKEANNYLEQSYDTVILATKYGNDKVFQNYYPEVKKTLNSLSIFYNKKSSAKKENNDMLYIYAKDIAKQKGGNVDDIYNQLEAMVANFSRAPERELKIETVYDFYKKGYWRKK